MLSKRAALLAAGGLWLLSTAPAPAQPVADPGFIYVDVNNDGSYDAWAGDIRLGTDIAVITRNTGKFDTQVSQSGYRAPCAAASLVVPASVQIVTPLALDLRAGGHIVVRGSVQAKSLYLQSGSAASRSGYTLQCYGGGYPTYRPLAGNVDLTGAHITVDTCLIASAGGKVTYNGTVIAGSDTANYGTPVTSLFAAFAGTDISGVKASVTVGAINLEAGGGYQEEDDCGGSYGGGGWPGGCGGYGFYCYPTPTPCPTPAPGNIDITASSTTFVTRMNLSAANNVTLNGALVTGGDLFSMPPYTSTVAVRANGNVTASGDSSTGQAFSVMIGRAFSLLADGNIAIDRVNAAGGPGVLVLGQNSAGAITAGGAVTVADASLTFGYDYSGVDTASGAFAIEADGACKLTGSSLTAGSISVDSCGDLTLASDDFGGSSVYCPWKLTTQSGGKTFLAAGTALNVNGAAVNSQGSISAAGVSLNAGTGAAIFSSCRGGVALSSAFLTAGGGLSASAACDLALDRARVRADQYVKLTAYGKLLAADSDVQFFVNPNAAGYLKAQAYGALDASRALWLAPASIALKSCWCDIAAPGATFAAAQNSFYAGGGDIDLTGAAVTGATTFGPSGVRVAGP